MKFNDRLRELIHDQRLSDVAFAERVGITKATLSGYLSGKRSPNQKILANIVNAFVVNANWLLTGYGPMYRHAKQAAEQSADYETTDERIYRRQAEAYQAQKEYMEYVMEQLSAANAPDEMKQQAIMEILMPSHDPRRQNYESNKKSGFGKNVNNG